MEGTFLGHFLHGLAALAELFEFSNKLTGSHDSFPVSQYGSHFWFHLKAVLDKLSLLDSHPQLPENKRIMVVPIGRLRPLQ